MDLQIKEPDMSDIADLKEDIKEIKDTTKDIFKVLNGNGSVGLVTRTALNAQSIKRAWWWLGGISLGIIGLAFFVVRVGLLNLVK